MPAHHTFPDPLADCSIDDDGAIGDCRTLALVSRFGSIDRCGEPGVTW